MLTQDKGRSANKAQKQQNNTPKPKQQKKSNENSITVCHSKSATGTKKTQGKHQTSEKNFHNGKQFLNIPQKPERASERQNATTRPSLTQPSTLPSCQKNSVSILKKK